MVPSVANGSERGCHRPPQHEPTQLLNAYWRQQLPIIERRLRYVAILLAALKWEIGRARVYEPYLAE